MKSLHTHRITTSQNAGLSFGNLAHGLAALLLAASNLSAAAPPERLVRCGSNEAETTIRVTYQTPQSAPVGLELYAKTFKKGDEMRPAPSPFKAGDAMGTETTTLPEFGETEVIFKIKQIPGPDRINPYQVAIHAPFRQNVSGTVDGTKYEVTWFGGAKETNSPNAVSDVSGSVDPAQAIHPAIIVNSVTLSRNDLMMVPHDSRLAYDVQTDPELGPGSWIQLQAKDPTGDIAQTFRIQVVDDPEGNLGTAEVAEAEIRAVCAPYLLNSLERRCLVQSLPMASGNVYYCILTNAAFSNGQKPPASQFRNLFLGVFRIGANAAVVVGHFSEKDDVNYRMMMETLGKISRLPIANGADPLPIRVKGAFPQ